MRAIAFASGAACKIYDDLNDNGYLQNPTHKRLLEGFQYITLTLISSSDFALACFFYTANVLNAMSNPTEWAKPFETSILSLYPILIAVSFGSAMMVTFTDILALGAMVASLAVEPSLIPEEVSVRKFGVRFGCVYLFALALLCMTSLSRTSTTLLWYGIGYFGVSSMFQMLKLAYEPTRAWTPAPA